MIKAQALTIAQMLGLVDLEEVLTYLDEEGQIEAKLVMSRDVQESDVCTIHRDFQHRLPPPPSRGEERGHLSPSLLSATSKVKERGDHSMKIFVTGATGVLGRPVVKALVEAEYQGWAQLAQEGKQ